MAPDIERLNWDHVRIQRSFKIGAIDNLAKEYKDGKLRHFRDLPDILPVRLRPGTSLDPTLDYDNITTSQKA